MPERTDDRPRNGTPDKTRSNNDGYESNCWPNGIVTLTHNQKSDNGQLHTSEGK
ncbi:hypothetical protein [Halapricum hydrolyticum]|uniref:Uncharacterized protein n=1 Tax=Halapricum hydrolyticum TaxID=2979991 RepID=A0AAE3ICX8_9EURY|nr:hypothetical protein [Halapricum hydrolyticum]MCU4717789.1 hypothetical protein [Halapricum hydrolyticum]MCU4726953.1 hypothetical protein [Halapricum hydrolyticum]